MRRSPAGATLAILTAALLVLELAPQAAGAHPLTGDEAPARGVRLGKYAVGDSVMLGAAGSLRARGFTVNATVSRQFTTGVALVRDLARSGRLPRKVVFHLGTNGVVLADVCDQMVRVIGHERVIWLVTLKVPRSWQEPNNRKLRACAHRHRRAHLIPWNSYSHGHPSWFASDGYHLTSSGRVAYARLIDGYVSGPV